MGAEQSKNGQQNPGFVQRFLPGKTQFEPMPIPKIIDLEFILRNRPTPLQNIQSSFQQNQEQIAQEILRYNTEKWNFGNLQGGTSSKFMNEVTYNSFLEFVKSKLVPNTSFNNTKIENKESFEEIKNIINKIHIMGIPEVNKFFSVKLSVLFPEISGFTDTDFIIVTLLGLAAIIGAEHLVIYFLMCGADPSITYKEENEDTATLMLLYQIGLSKIQSPPKYFIILGRILYILFLLGSVGSGVDLSKLFASNFKVLKRNQGLTQVKESILHQLVKMPYIPIDFSNQNKLLIYLKMQNGASIPLLFKIIEKNNIDKGPKLWSNLNTQDLPFGYTVLYNLLMNNTIESNIKLSLAFELINAGADPLIIPSVRQNASITQSVFAKENQTEIQLLFALLQESNLKILGDLLKILSINTKFKTIYDGFKRTNLGVNQDKNMTIQRLFQNNERLRNILLEVEKQKLIQLNSAIKESALIGKTRENLYQNLGQNLGQNPGQKFGQNPGQKFGQNPYQNLGQKFGQNPSQNPGQNPGQKFGQNLYQNPGQIRGGKKIDVRTFYLLKHKKYYEYPFESERPIIAAHNAYDFLKLHDNIGKKKIIISIYDIANNKKYKYIAKTLKDGKNVLKSSK